MKKVAIYPGGATAFARQLLMSTLDPEAMKKFWLEGGFEKILELGFSNWASLATALGGHDYKPAEMIGMQENPGYRIPGLDPAAETDLAAGGFDYLGPHSPSVPSSAPRPSGITPEPDPDLYFEKLSSTKKFRLANQPQPPEQNEANKPPMPNKTFEDLIAELKQIENSSKLSNQLKMQNYRRILDEYNKSLAPLRVWMKENGYSKQQTLGIVNEAQKRRR